MKEQITNMIKKHFYSASGTPEKSAEEITDHVSEFNKWCMELVYRVGKDYYLIVPFENDIIIGEYEELYNFWYSNVFLKTKKG
jgi:hypothetical protein